METVIFDNNLRDLEDLIRYYCGIKPKYTLGEICDIINIHHNVNTTVRQIRYICQKNNIGRSTPVADENLREMVSNELSTTRRLVGYRQMTEIISLKYNVHVSKERVRILLKELDPQGVEERTNNILRRRVYHSKGPGDTYHIDGNDKLKRWGFCIHGGVDGFSRKILWLKVATTNNDPLVIANYFLDCVKLYGFAPKLVRMDKGTENIYCEDLQVFFTKSQDSFRYGASTRNQRIEAFWSRLKKFNLIWWIGFFNEMFRDGLFKAHLDSHREVLIFCFLPVIQNQLNEFGRTWNTRNVRKSAETPGGKPDFLFTVPDSVGCSNQGIPVDPESLRVADTIVRIRHHPVWIDKDLHELLKCYIVIHKLSIPREAEEGLLLYPKLLNLLEVDGFEI